MSTISATDTEVQKPVNVFYNQMLLENARPFAPYFLGTQAGTLSENAVYNENSHTWWIDLEMKDEFAKDYCNPACVVSADTQTAEINWRCTGAVPPEISSFDECVAAGYPVMESYPRQCKTSDGTTFVEEIVPCVDRCGDGECQRVVCLETGCPCAETPESCPEDCS